MLRPSSPIYEVTMEENQELDVQSLIDEFKKFEQRSYKRYKDLFEQIKKDRIFINGDQFDDVDTNLVGDVANDCKLNVVSNVVRTIVNSYLPYQYKWSFENQPELNKVADEFLSNVDNYTASVEALTNAVSTSLGVIVFSTDYDIDGSIKPIMYSIPDVTNVRLDPDATKLNFSDATKAAIVEIKSKEWIKDNYGIDVDNLDKPLVDISQTYDHDTSLPVVTFYVKEKQGIIVYKLAGNDLLEQPTMLPYSYIPVVPVFGEQSWEKDKITWSGITKQMRPIQRLINYSYRQLILRCAIAPKNDWVISDEAVDGYEKYYKDSNKIWNSLRMFHKYSKDGKRELPEPHRENNIIEFQDVNQLMQNSLQMVDSVIGIPATGLETDVQRSATEALINLKTFNNNIRNYLYHLKFSMQLLGMLFAENYFGQQLFGKIKVNVIEGPDGAMEKEEARVQFQQYGQMLTSDVDKQKLVMAECAVEADNEYITNFANMLQPTQTPLEMQQQDMLQQADGEIKKRDAQIAELQKQIEDLNNQQQIQAYSLQREMLLADQKFNHEKELKILDAQLEQSNPATQAKTQAEIYKANASIEKEALNLQKEQIKASQPQINVVQNGGNN